MRKEEELNMSLSRDAANGEEIGVSIDTTAIECSLKDVGEIQLKITQANI